MPLAPRPLPTNPRDLIALVKKFIPPLLDTFHKGQHGRVAVVGGSEDYTGAPFFSANASALLGCDMSHIICTPGAAIPIKSYSPNIMVSPLLQSTLHAAPHETPEYLSSRIATTLLPRLHTLVIGPGLGRDELMQSTVRELILKARNLNMPMVIDADALLVVQNTPETIRGYKSAILTPNIMEFRRLCSSLGVALAPGGGGLSGTPVEGDGELCAKLARELGGVTVVQKGRRDYISNGEETVVCDLEGGLKRSGGQGDTLTGTLGTFLAWKVAYQSRIWEHDNSLTNSELTALCAYAAAATTRYCSRLSYAKKGRSLQASDLSMEVGNAFKALFESDTPDIGQRVGAPESANLKL